MNSNRCHNKPLKLIWPAIFCVGPTRAEISCYCFACVLHLLRSHKKISAKILLVWLFARFACFAPIKTLCLDSAFGQELAGSGYNPFQATGTARFFFLFFSHTSEASHNQDEN
jgi:hypothetical protein